MATRPEFGPVRGARGFAAGQTPDSLETVWAAQPKQSALLHDYAHVFEVLYGGAAGPGKSEYLLAYNILRRLKYPSTSGLFLRREFQQLVKSEGAIARSHALLRGAGAHWNGSERVWTFPGGGRLEFGHLHSEEDKHDYQSAAYADIQFDELTQFTETQYLYLWSRARTTLRGCSPTIRAATNPGGAGHCLPYGDVLTPDGWKPLEAVVAGDLVATSDAVERLVFVAVDHATRHDYDGPLLEHHGRTATIVCTPGHRIARRTETKTPAGRTLHGITLTAAEDLATSNRLVRTARWDGGTEADRETFAPEPVATRALKLDQPLEIPLRDYAELVGWMVSEGHTLDRDKEFGISQSKPEQREEIRELLDRCGFSYRESGTGFAVSSPTWWAHFQVLGKCREKYIPRVVKEASSDVLRAFFDAAMAGDGHAGTYYTTSAALADDMFEVGMKLGYCPRLVRRQRPERDGPSYEMRFRIGRDGYLERANFVTTHHVGPVYCLGIPDLHRFFVRQDGTVWLSGNSWVKRRFIDPQPAGSIGWFKRVSDADTPCPPNDPKGRSRAFVAGRIADNPILLAANPEYLATLEGLPDADRRALLEGDWDAWQGQVFTAWHRDTHVVRTRALPPSWPRVVGLDYGTHRPFAAVWLARGDRLDDDPPAEAPCDRQAGHIYAYREVVKAGLTDEAMAHAVALYSTGERIAQYLADPSSFFLRNNQTGQSPALLFHAQGIRLVPANNDRIAGKRALETALARCACGVPRLRAMDRCTELIRAIPSLPYDPHNVEDVDTKAEGDDIYDSCRYALMGPRPQSDRPYATTAMSGQHAYE